MNNEYYYSYSCNISRDGPDWIVEYVVTKHDGGFDTVVEVEFEYVESPEEAEEILKEFKESFEEEYGKEN